MEKQTFEQAVNKVVSWWVEKSFRTPLNQNNGDNSMQGGTVHMLMNVVSIGAQKTLSEEKIKKFEVKLTEILIEKHQQSLSVDYHPCEELSGAAEFAGIDLDCFPCKSSTWIDMNNKAFGKYQYGGSSVEL